MADLIKVFPFRYMFLNQPQEGNIMFGKAIDFVVTVAINGVIALIFSIFLYVILAIIFSIAMIPVAIIAGDGIATAISNFVDNDISFRLVYAIVFISMMLDDLGVPNFKTAFKKWREKRKQRK